MRHELGRYALGRGNHAPTQDPPALGRPSRRCLVREQMRDGWILQHRRHASFMRGEVFAGQAEGVTTRDDKAKTEGPRDAQDVGQHPTRAAGRS